MSIQDLIIWIVSGALSGPAAGAVLAGKREGFGKLTNLLLGLAGAIIGGIIINLLKTVGIDNVLGIQITLDQLIASFSGALIFVFGYRRIRTMLNRDTEAKT